MAKANLEAAKGAYPSVGLGDEAWKKFFDTPEGFSAMGRIFGDIYDELLAIEEKERGLRSLGRRPSRVEVPLDAVFAKIFGVSHSNESFPVALAAILVGRSQRQFANKVPIDQSTLSRYLSGTKTPSMEMIERIARAAKIDPAHFVEWRAEFISGLFHDALLHSPHIGLKMVRNIKSLQGKL